MYLICEKKKLYISSVYLELKYLNVDPNVLKLNIDIWQILFLGYFSGLWESVSYKFYLLWF